jgi:hypothetical protein
MPLDFNLQWVIDRKPSYPYSGFYSYSIDNGDTVSIESNQSANDQYARYQEDFKINPSFSYSINISSLTNGYHNIVITAYFYTGSNEIFNVASPPFQFLVDNLTPSPSPTVPEFPVALVVIFPVMVVVGFAVVYQRKLRV